MHPCDCSRMFLDSCSWIAFGMFSDCSWIAFLCTPARLERNPSSIFRLWGSFERSLLRLQGRLEKHFSSILKPRGRLEAVISSHLRLQGGTELLFRAGVISSREFEPKGLPSGSSSHFECDSEAAHGSRD